MRRELGWVEAFGFALRSVQSRFIAGPGDEVCRTVEGNSNGIDRGLFPNRGFEVFRKFQFFQKWVEL